MRHLALLIVASLPLLGHDCAGPSPSRGYRIRTGPTEPTRQSTAPRFEPIRVEALEPGADPPVFAMKGEPVGESRLVFLHGMCGHGLGYAQSFQYSAAKRGRLISPQGDVRCGNGPWAKWSADVEALDARICDAFRKLGHPEPCRDVAVIGYSQGASRAEALARKWPDRYTMLILIGAPRAPEPWGLTKLRSVVMMAGERDRQDLMKMGDRNMRAVGIPSKFMVIPEARHGGMGSTPERTMGEALDFLFEHARPVLGADSGSG